MKYKPGANLAEENKKCVICIEEFAENDELKILFCTHRFHASCLDNWLKNSIRCPICKRDVRDEGN